MFGQGDIHQEIDRAELLVLEHDVFDERERQAPTLHFNGITFHATPLQRCSARDIPRALIFA
jgi:hypothetical protein